MKIQQLIPKIGWGLWGLAAVLVFALICVAGVSGFDYNHLWGALTYDLLVLLPLIVIGVLATIQARRNPNRKPLKWIWLVLGVVWLVTVWLVNYSTSDSVEFLRWCQAYHNLSWADALREINTVSNYVPFYNYFLIIFAHLFSLEYCLYAVRYLTFVFSLVLAVVVELIVCAVRQSKFNYLHLAGFLLLPPVLLEFAAWVQCDAIYATFALLAFYFALKHRSVGCFICLGLAFAVKLQFLFIVPMIFVMLLIRDADGKKYLSWKWIWLAPLMYVVNLIPFLAGAPLSGLLAVYLGQAGYYTRFSMNCLNLSYLLNPLSKLDNSVLTTVVTVMMVGVGVAVTVTLLVLVLRAHRRQPLTTADIVRYALCFAMTMVYFMPKMHERFYFLAMTLAFICLCVQPAKWHNLLGTMMITALTISFFTYLFRNGVDLNDHVIYWVIIIAVNVLGWLMNTLVVVGLWQPIIADEIKAHAARTKAAAQPSPAPATTSA